MKTIYIVSSGESGFGQNVKSVHSSLEESEKAALALAAESTFEFTSQASYVDHRDRPVHLVYEGGCDYILVTEHSVQ